MAFVGFLRQSTAVDLPVGPFLDSADGNTVESALTITQPDVRLKKNGAAWAQKNAAQTLSHEENGHYEVALDTTDTNTLGLLRLVIHESGGLQIVQDYMVVVASVWDLFCLRGLSMLGLVAYGTALGGAAGNIQLAAATSFADDLLNGSTALITGGTGVGQSRVGSDFVGATDTLSVDPDFGTAPDSTSEYSIFGTPPAPTGAAVPLVTLANGAHGGASAVITADITGDVTGNLSGSVGSVTGAVGSVTGAVGSVTGAVGSVTGNVGGNVVGSVASVTAGVTLADGAHGGAAATLALKSIAVANSDAGGVAVSITGSGSGNSHGILVNSTNAKALALGSTNSDAVSIDAPAGTGIVVTGLTADITADINGTIAGLGTQAKADVNAEVVDVINTDTTTELAAVPAATAPLRTMIRWLFLKARNKITQTATTQTVLADDGSTPVAASTVSDDGTTATRGEFS